MNWSEFINYIDPKLFALVAALWAIGYMLKSTNKVVDWSIPFILLPLSIVGTVFLIGGTPESVIQGVLCAAVASYGYDLFKQITGRK